MKRLKVKSTVELDQDEQAKRQAVREKLLGMGFPADLPNTLDAYIYRCGLETASAEGVVTEKKGE